MRVEFRVTGAKRFNAKTKSIRNYARTKYSADLVNIGYTTAKQIAPKDTGALIRAIRKPKKNKQSAYFELKQPNNARTPNRPYHLWMHGIKAPAKAGGGAGSGYDTSSGTYRPRSGEPKFMEVAFREMQRRATETFKKKINKL